MSLFLLCGLDSKAQRSNNPSSPACQAYGNQSLLLRQWILLVSLQSKSRQPLDHQVDFRPIWAGFYPTLLNSARLYRAPAPFRLEPGQSGPSVRVAFAVGDQSAEESRIRFVKAPQCSCLNAPGHSAKFRIIFANRCELKALRVISDTDSAPTLVCFNPVF